MPKVVRVGDSLSTGHGCTGTTTIASSNQGVDNVYANGILAVSYTHLTLPTILRV